MLLRFVKYQVKLMNFDGMIKVQPLFQIVELPKVWWQHSKARWKTL